MSRDPFASGRSADPAPLPSRPPRRPFSPFVRLWIGTAATALVTEWARFQADLAWAALPLGAGAVVTLASVTRGVVARRRWRTEVAAWVEADAARTDAATDAFVAAPSAADPRGVTARRRDPALSRPALGAKPAIAQHPATSETDAPSVGSEVEEPSARVSDASAWEDA